MSMRCCCNDENTENNNQMTPEIANHLAQTNASRSTTERVEEGSKVKVFFDDMLW